MFMLKVLLLGRRESLVCSGIIAFGLLSKPLLHNTEFRQFDSSCHPRWRREDDGEDGIVELVVDGKEGA